MANLPAANGIDAYAVVVNGVTNAKAVGMTVVGAYLTGLATSALAAGVVAANAVAPVGPPPAAADVGLAATVIPIVDFGGSLGPLTFLRQLTAEFDGPPTILASLKGHGETSWTAPIGPIGDVTHDFLLPLSLTSPTGPVADLGFEPQASSSVVSLPFGASGPIIDLKPEVKSSTHLLAYLGGPDGYGIGTRGTLLQLGLQGGVSQPEIQAGGEVFLGQYTSQFSVIPFSGLIVGGTLTPYAGGGGASIQLGPVKLGSSLPSGQTGVGAKLCLGSAASGACGGMIVQASVKAMLGASVLTVNGTDVISYDFPDQLDVKLTSSEFSIVGKVGGTVKIGSASIGQPVDIDIHIPLPSASMATSQASDLRQSGTTAAPSPVKTARSLPGISRKVAATNATADTDTNVTAKDVKRATKKPGNAKRAVKRPARAR
jgi:hypothetical protein